MGEIIEHSGNGDAGVEAVHIGESGSTVSLKVYQDVYHQVTGKTEQIRKRYSDHLLVDYSEVEQLNYKVQQLCDVHKIVACNESVSIFHEKERKEQFTSFERFKAYNSNASSPTLNLVLKYNFSIVPSGINKPQEYAITINLTSRVTMHKHLQNDVPPFMRGKILGFFATNTAEITVDYADYVIARGFIEAFDEWIRGCKKTPEARWLTLMQQWSHAIPPSIRLAVAAIISYFACISIPPFFGDSQSLDLLARYLVVYVGGAYITISAIGMTGSLIEQSIDSYPILSYLKLNKGDTNLIDEFKVKRRMIAVKFLAGSLGTILLGIAATKLEKLL